MEEGRGDKARLDALALFKTTENEREWNGWNFHATGGGAANSRPLAVSSPNGDDWFPRSAVLVPHRESLESSMQLRSCCPERISTLVRRNEIGYAYLVPPSESDSRDSSIRRPQFTTTHWSVVRAAGRDDSSQARAALEKLARAYWYPLYAFVRRLGKSPHDAEDAVQAFFAQCLEKNYVGAADQAKGRFRSFLLLALKRFLGHERERARALKRGGGEAVVALDGLTAEQRYALEPADQMSADRLYERRWALALLEQVLARLRSEHVAAGRLETFEQLKGWLTSGGRGTPYAELAGRLGMRESAVKVSVHRLRRRYRELLEEEIAQTVASSEEVEEERRHLLAVLGG